MAQTIQIKRGLFTNLSGITPASGEIVWTTDTHQLLVGDNSTAGGIEIDYIGNGQKGIANGVATLDSNIKLDTNQLPAEAIVNATSVASQAAQLALTVTQGDLCKRTDERITYVALNSNNSSMSDWMGLNVPSAINTVNGMAGDVTLVTGDIAEGIGDQGQPANLWYTDARVNSYVVNTLIDDNTASASSLYSSSKIDSLVSSTLVYKGAWDASTNTPTLSDATGVQNEYYIVSVAGTQDLGSGSITFSEGDDVIFNGTVWERFGSVNAVASVNSKVGVVVLDGSDIALDGYVAATSASAIVTTDTVNEALGKLEFKADNVVNNVQADWAEVNTAAESYINNKPTLVQNLTDLGDTPNIIASGDVGKVLRVDSTTSFAYDLMSLGDGDNVDAAVDDYTTLDTLGNKNVLAWSPNATTPADGKWAPQNIDNIITVPFTQLSDTPSDYTAGAGYVPVINATTNGLEFVTPTSIGRTTIAALDDTTIGTLTTGEVLTYDGTDWKNLALPVGVTALDGLSDVTIGTLADGDCLSYNSITSQWENTQPDDILFSLGELTNVAAAVDTATAGQVLKYSGTAWEAQTDNQTTTFDALTDTPTGTMGTSAGYALKVNAGGTAIEYVDTSVIDGGTF